MINEADEAMCVCPRDQCPRILEPVCGTDGQTYDNECLMKEASCLKNVTIEQFSKGNCGDPCQGSGCKDRPYSLGCQNIDGKAVCICPMHCPEKPSYVCGSDGIQYESECMLKRLSCLSNKTITVAYTGECTCNQTADIALLVDTSGSISRRNWVKMRAFVEKFVEGFNISPNGVHFAIVTYSTRARVILSFGGLLPSMMNTFMVKQRISRMKWDRGFTYIDKVLITAEKTIFTTARGMRKGVPAFALLITDGKQTRNRGAYVEPKIAAAGLKRNGVRIFTLGISKYASQKELAAVASNKRNVFTADSFDDLEQVRSLIKSTICKESRRVQAKP